MRLIARLYFWLIGWKAKNEVSPELKKYVMIGVPHTSNWDFPIAMAALSILRLKTNYLAKRELFRFPLGIIMRAFGGIPVDRSQSKGMVEAMIQELNRRENLILMIPPEGTRKYVKEWKTGFYRVAMGANVPIVLAYLDYGTKTTGLKTVFYPTGDYEKDLVIIRSYYQGMKGKYPENQSL